MSLHFDQETQIIALVLLFIVFHSALLHLFSFQLGQLLLVDDEVAFYASSILTYLEDS